MNKIHPSETELIGSSKVDNGELIPSDVTKRIWMLTSEYLELVAQSQTGWELLYRDPQDNRLWEESYPQSSLQGGGPPILRCISKDEAKNKFGSW